MREKIEAGIYKFEALCATTLAVALFGMMSQSAFAVDGSEAVPGGGVIEFTGAAEVSRVGADELLLKFSDTATAGTVKLPGLTKARILAIGGGGGGAGAYSKGFSGDYGSGGGGGAGGLVEITNMMSAAEYVISIGAGGGAGSSSTSESKWPGENGGNTTITKNGSAFLTAYGGGGGNGHGVGFNGGSGGGGSRSVDSDFSGGMNLPEAAGQGFSGGAGDEPLYGGGGGGAGGSGADASSKDPVGGIGRQSDITGELDYYAGGGGGSYGNSVETTTGIWIDGGLGGGGKGGYGKKNKATAGENGKGGGGGGVHAAAAGIKGGAGGSGVVYMRISAAISGALEKPTDQIVPYDGETHTVVSAMPFYTISGDLEGKEIGVYSATVSLNLVDFPSLTWADGSTDDVFVLLAITSETTLNGSEVVYGGGTVTYAGASAIGWVDNSSTGSKDLLLTFANTESKGAVKFSGLTLTRILAIGGGGGGGGANSKGYSGNYGSGGGGGAGGMVEITNMMSAAVYAINIGAGGAAGSSTTTASKWPGENGGNTTITKNGSAFLTAYGGGGGNGHGAGSNGGSGGGGSQDGSGNAYAGGSVMPEAVGQGFLGGAGDEALYGGGGGGAGGSGADASSKNPVGGIGRQSDITGEFDYYAGGGGGGYGSSAETTTGIWIDGGLGGGGKGGYGKKNKATAGENGKGGGGGGVHAAAAGIKAGAGGSGIVYVRISMSFDGDIEKPVTPQNYVYDGQAHTSVVESVAYTISGPVIGTAVGDYVATVTLIDGLEWKDGGNEPAVVEMHITKAQAEFISLTQKGWMYGTPDTVVPRPKYELNLPNVTPTFEYADAEGGPYRSSPPTEIGIHWLRATVADTDSYAGTSKTVSFEIAKGLGETFTDYVEITIEGYKGTDPSELTNYPYKVTLSEKDPNGFLYSRVGSPDQMAFTDLANNVLDYMVDKWDPEDKSVVYVRIPLIAATNQTIRLYWSVRPGSAAPAHHPETVWTDWPPERYEQIADPPAGSFDFVYRDGNKVNSWAIAPHMTKTVWDEHDEPGRLDVAGKLKVGEPDWRIESVFSPTVDYGQTMPVKGGAYRYVWVYEDPTGEFERFEDSLAFTIFGHNPIDDFGDALQTTASGRVLLMNDDTAKDHAVDGQSYWHTNDQESVFWVHSDPDSCTRPNVLDGAEHTLYHVDRETGTTNVLWHLKDVLIGNNSSDTSPFSSVSGQCFLPWSSTSEAVSAPGLEPGQEKGAGQIVMRNVVGATVYSPIYTNGIGTIYFDAVNAYTRNIADDPYRLRVEVVTGDTADDIREVSEEAWQPCTMLPLKRDNTPDFVVCPETEKLSLDISHDKSTNNFYRVCVKVEKRGAVRFRIVRDSQIVNVRIDLTGFILIDNIIVSHPRNTADLMPYGRFDLDRKGKLILGQGGATTVPFPAVGEQRVYARAQTNLFANAQCEVDPLSFVTFAEMSYRWRYLDQASNDWKTVELWPSDGFVARKQLELPEEPGDIEFFYVAHVQAPYYRYYDYSGLGIGVDAKLYTEENAVVTNRMPIAERRGASLPSCGTDWFFRLRNGKSATESWRLYVDRDGEITPYDLEMSSGGTWRGYFPTRQTGDVRVRLEQLNAQVAGMTRYAVNTNYFRLQGDATLVPWATSSLVAAADTNEWSTIACDATTGSLMLQLEEGSRGVSVVHADYQDFNAWSDANREPGKFVGTSTDLADPAAAGTAPEVRKYPEAFDTWHVSEATNPAYWAESFLVEPREMQPGGAWEVYRPFTGAQNTPNGFTAGPGQWITGWYRDVNSGMAYQMQGQGYGYMQIVNYMEAPRGIGSISFKARLGQSVNFGDVCYYPAGIDKNMTNYTFVTRAAYDLNSRKDFTGNASLSVFAFYRPSVGAYELRVEQVNGNSATQITGPGGIQRLSLYRWRYDANKGGIRAECLGSREVNNASALTTLGESGNYGALFIDVVSTSTKASGVTYVRAGMTRNTAALSSTSAADTSWVWFNDDSDQRLMSGTYGVLSANCPARFMVPAVYIAGRSSTTPATTTDVGFKYNDNSKFNWPTTGKRSCYNEIVNDDGWEIMSWRMQKVANPSTSKFGLMADPAPQPIEVYIAKAGTTDWTYLMSTNVSSFGSMTPIKIDLYRNDDCSIRIQTGGDDESARNDVVIDDFEIAQWRGESYDDKEGATYFDMPGYGSPTNFVFTQAWVVKGAYGETNCQLNARRAQANVATSVRSPLMDGEEGRGLGLGMLTFSYANAQPNVRLLLQVATNNLSLTSLATASKSVSAETWTTVTNYNFATLPKDGTLSYYFGLHGVRGAMRLVMDPEVVKAVAEETDPAKFGTIDITSVLCRDEPALDSGAWWGWNLRTTNDPDKMNLVDVAARGTENGLSLVLNNSVTRDIIPADAAQYPEHLPFVQTPTFRSEQVGEVSFKARKHAAGDQPTRVVLFGAKAGLTELDRDWRLLKSWVVSNTTFRTFTHKTALNDNYCAFRLAVTGVADVINPMDDPEAPAAPLRVVVDEVLVTEAIRAQVGFRNVAAFRSYLDTMGAVPDIMDRAEQPLCKEAWGVQGEVYAMQLADEVDLSSAQVRLWWFSGAEPWGFERWRDKPGSHCAWLAPCGNTNLVFRSSYIGAPEAVMLPQDKPGVVQYMLEVVYRTSRGEAATNWLAQADWQTPSWYAPVDYNADNGGVDDPERFSAYTILDTVAPGWAWFNEINVFGEFDYSYENSDKPFQFIEIAAPYDADLTDWSVRIVEPNIQNGRVTTNELARFGEDLPGLKAGNKGMDDVSKCVFHVLASPNATFDKADGRLDGTWRAPSAMSAMSGSGEIATSYPLSIQLVRPTGIVEHEIVAIGTNDWADIPSYDPNVHVQALNANERGGRFFYVGMDSAGLGTNAPWSASLGVHYGNGGTEKTLAEDASKYWSNTMGMTPGRKNELQEISPDCPRPLGSSVLIVSEVKDAHVRQSFGEVTNTAEKVIVVYRKNSEKGTNITYTTDRWYELRAGGVTVNGVPAAWEKTGPNTYTVEVGRDVDRDLTVIAASDVRGDLETKYGLTPDNRYREAVMDWLLTGVDAYGNAWHNPETDAIGLADFVSLSGNVVTNMSLTEMYWLDMDPTWNDHDLQFKAGIVKAPNPVVIPGYPEYMGANDSTLTNVRMSVKLMITNTSPLAVAGRGPAKSVWAPYVLRSATPGVTSWDYADPASSWSWNSVTFKITGILANGLTREGNPSNWVPLRWFVFDENSFDDNFTSKVEVDDPYSTSSPGYDAHWYEWVQEHGWCPVFFSWNIDDRLRPVSVEILRPDSTFGD